MAQYNTHKTTAEGKQQTLERKRRRSEKYRQTTINVGGYARRERNGR